MSCSLHKGMSLEVLDVRYGADGSDKDLLDVTDLVRKKISTDRKTLTFVVSPSNIGVADPAAGQKKIMLIKYKLSGQEHSERVRDGDTFAVTVPEPTKKTPSQYLAVFYSALWSNFAGALTWFLQVMGFAFGWQLGKYFGNSYVWTILNILFPYASFWLIPAIVIIARAIGGADFIKPMAMGMMPPTQ